MFTVPGDVAAVIVAAALSFGVALGTLAFARKAGISDIDRVVREQRGALVSALTQRVEQLEAENKRLSDENVYLKRELAQLKDEVDRLRRRIVNGDDPDA